MLWLMPCPGDFQGRLDQALGTLMELWCPCALQGAGPEGLERSLPTLRIPLDDSMVVGQSQVGRALVGIPHSLQKYLNLGGV